MIMASTKVIFFRSMRVFCVREKEREREREKRATLMQPDHKYEAGGRPVDQLTSGRSAEGCAPAIVLIVCPLGPPRVFLGVVVLFFFVVVVVVVDVFVFVFVAVAAAAAVAAVVVVVAGAGAGGGLPSLPSFFFGRVDRISQTMCEFFVLVPQRRLLRRLAAARTTPKRKRKSDTSKQTNQKKPRNKQTGQKKPKKNESVTYCGRKGSQDRSGSPRRNEMQSLASPRLL